MLQIPIPRFRPPVLIPATLLAVGSILTMGSPASGASCVPSRDSAVTPAAYQQQPIMLADEIIRRLRRIGINVNKTRLPHPYDPDEGVC